MKPPAGDVIGGYGVLRERHRVSHVRRGDHRAQPHAAGRAGHAREPRDRGEPRAPAVPTPRHVVVGPEVVVTERLDATGALERLGPRIGREHQDADTHRGSLPRFAAPYDQAMTVELNHTIVWCRDQQRRRRSSPRSSAGRRRRGSGPSSSSRSTTASRSTYHETDEEIAEQHYAFLIGEDDFDDIFGRIVERGLDHWADPMRSHAGEINHHDGGRGVVLPRSRRAPARDHHPSVRQRFVTRCSPHTAGRTRALPVPRSRCACRRRWVRCTSP